MLIKKEILTVPQLQPETFLEIDKTKKNSEDFILTAHVENIPRSGKVLMVEIFSSYGMEKRFITNGDSFIIYDFKTGEWNNRSFYGNISGSGYCYYYPELKADDKSRKIVLDYLYPGKEHKDYYYRDIGYICNEITTNKAIERRQTAALNKAQRIKRHIAMAPEITKEILAYCKDKIFPQYVFYGKLSSKGIRTGKCSNCGKSIRLPQTVKHKSETTCPKCGCSAFLWAKQYIISATKKILLTVCRNIDNQLIISNHEIVISFDGALKPHYSVDMVYVRLYLKGERKEIYSYKWKCVQFHGWNWYEDKWTPSMSTAVYPGNLQEIFGDKYYGVNIQSIFEAYTGTLNFVKLLDNLQNYPQAEYLVKIGLVKLASEMGSDEFGNSKNLKQLLGINKSLVPLYIRREVSLAEHRMIQAVGSITDEQLTTLREMKPNIRTREYIGEILEKVTLVKLLNYLPKQKALYPKVRYEQIICWYRDLFNMYDDLDIPVRKNMKCPKDLKQIHDTMAAQLREIAAENEVEYFKIAKGLLKAESENFSADGFVIVLPRCRTDFTREGQELHHCVGLSQYYENHISGEKMIFFIRKVADVDVPFVTMQVDMKSMTVSQIYGAYDKSPEKEVRDFARKFIKFLKKTKKKEDVNSYEEKQNLQSKKQYA